MSESNASFWSGEIGFQIEAGGHLQPEVTLITGVADCYLDILPPTLFAVIECSIEDKYVCFTYVQFVKKYGFEPIGDKMECYSPADRSKYQLMVPVLSLQ